MEDSLNKRIKDARLSKGLTLLEVANKLGVTEATVQRYESGEIKNIKHKTIVKLSNIYGVTPAHLMGWEESEGSSEADIKTIAAHAIEDLSDDEIKKVIEFAQFIKSQHGKS